MSIPVCLLDFFYPLDMNFKNRNNNQKITIKMKQSEEELIKFHAIWKVRCTYPAKSWYFIVYGILFLGIGILNYHSYPCTISIIMLYFSMIIFLSTFWITYHSRKVRHKDFFVNYRYLLYAIQEYPTNTTYHRIFYEYEEFIGIKQMMNISQIIKCYRRFSDSKFYNGENKDRILAYQYEDTLEILAKRHKKVQEIILSHT